MMVILLLAEAKLSDLLHIIIIDSQKYLYLEVIIMSFMEINISELSFNPFEKISKEWFLLTAGDENGFNTMTASWGFMGVMWGKNTLTTVIRPSRYTLEFVEKNDFFTISFFDENKRDSLQFCGSHSGRDCDKAKEAGLTPLFIDNTTTFDEATLVFVCRKVYFQDMDKAFLSDDMKTWYKDDEPMHKQFIGEITKVYVKE